MRMIAARLRRLYDELGRRLEARIKPLVAVRGGVGEGRERRGVLEDSADGVQSQLAEAGVAVTGQKRLPSFQRVKWVCMPEPLSP